MAADVSSALEALKERATTYAQTFDTPAGKKVLADLYRANLSTAVLRIEYFLRVADGTIDLSRFAKKKQQEEENFMPVWPEEGVNG